MTAALERVFDYSGRNFKLDDVDFTATLRARRACVELGPGGWNFSNQYAYSGDLLRLNFAEKRGAIGPHAEIAVPFLLDLPNRPLRATGALRAGVELRRQLESSVCGDGLCKATL